jgi:O-antigen/teichoic acid export membrane protein
MLLMLPVATAFPNDWTVAAVWGVGAALSAAVGWWQVRLRPSRIADATRWWKHDLRRLGSWLAVESVLVSAGSQALIIILAIILTTSEIGGIRVVSVVFAPMSLVNEAFTFPGIPIISRAIAESMGAARRWAWQLGLGALAIVGVYLAVVIPFSGQILSHVFGPEFEQFKDLVVPTAIGQLPIAAATGFLILLKADRRVHGIVAVICIRTAVGLLLAPILAVEFGVLGAVWGVTIAALVSGAFTVYFGLLSRDIPFFRFERFAMIDDSVVAEVGAE